ncbi:hypothetical protein FA13DRAFT_1101454 [Coprinellus micaceus]|uniref:Uncharacterized protein n=1 Tax=Coprinellus micaceus TaxID=71717 RepID=A0A4Y7SWJ5_COPMI|nr:hypothetical protein FA13DRAFT_1101454 [Coprinellus micaceus]
MRTQDAQNTFSTHLSHLCQLVGQAFRSHSKSSPGRPIALYGNTVTWRLSYYNQALHKTQLPPVNPQKHPVRGKSIHRDFAIFRCVTHRSLSSFTRITLEHHPIILLATSPPMAIPHLHFDTVFRNSMCRNFAISELGTVCLYTPPLAHCTMKTSLPRHFYAHRHSTPNALLNTCSLRPISGRRISMRRVFDVLGA